MGVVGVFGTNYSFIIYNDFGTVGFLMVTLNFSQKATLKMAHDYEFFFNDIPLIVDNRLNFDLYHGTSSRHLKSIDKFGFGYRDPELFNVELSRDLLVN